MNQMEKYARRRGSIEIFGIALIGVGVFRLVGLDWAILSVGLALYVETVR